MKKKGTSRMLRRRRAQRRRNQSVATSNVRESDILNRVMRHLKANSVPFVFDPESGRIAIECQYFPADNTALRNPDGEATVDMTLDVDAVAGFVTVAARVPWDIRVAVDKESVYRILQAVFADVDCDIARDDPDEGTILVVSQHADPESVTRRMLDILLVTHLVHPLVEPALRYDLDAFKAGYSTLEAGNGDLDIAEVTRRRNELTARLQDIGVARAQHLASKINTKVQAHALEVQRSTRNPERISLLYHLPCALAALIDGQTLVGHDIAFSRRRTESLLNSIDHFLSTTCRHRLVQVRATKFFSDGDGEVEACSV